MFIYKFIAPILLASGAILYCLITTTQTQAQITSDRTVSTEVKTTDNQNFTITGGSQTGNNLFHSFEDFSVPQSGAASFENSANIQNIIGRVTGSSVSEIDGLIKAQDNANLLLINPNGIIFGADARLDIGGSFLATTADTIQFSDGSQFSVTATQTEPLLTVTAPVGIQFGEKPGGIVNRSIGVDTEELPDGLSVDPGQTLALIGGDLQVDGGVLLAPGGRIELGSVGSFGVVDLTPLNDGWTFGYDQLQDFQNIQLSQAFITTSDFDKNIASGNIQLRGRGITITDQSRLGEPNLTANPGGTLSIKAVEFLAINDGSFLSTTAYSAGKAGDIEIETGRLIINTSASISTSTSTQDDGGRGGNITISASESIEIDGKGDFTELLTETQKTGGDGGNVNIATKNLILRDGGQISSSTRGESKGGNITLDVSESIEISGQGETNDEEIVKSGLFAQTENPEDIDSAVTGNGGTLNINTKSLKVFDGGSISVGAVNDSQGKAGNLNINALNSIDISGADSNLLASSVSSQPAGNLTIITDSLSVRDGAKISVSSTGSGAAGNLEVLADSINLDHGILSATTTVGEKGDIFLNANNIFLDNQSRIQTDTNNSTGGNIVIDTDNLAASNNSDITATAQQGTGGRVTIDADGIFGIEVREQLTNFNDIVVTSDLGAGFSGTAILRTPDVDPTSSVFELSDIPIDAESLFARDPCAFQGDRIAGGSSFTITGRGGLPPTIDDPLVSSNRVVNWASADEQVSSDGSVVLLKRSEVETPAENDNAEIEQAQGWVVSKDGSVYLTADAPQVTPQNPSINHPACRASL